PIWKTGIGRLTAEIEIGFARVADRPLADAVVQFEQAGLVGNIRARLGRNQAARRSRRDGRLLFARTLANEAARTDRTVLQLLRRELAPARRRSARRGGSGGSRRSFRLGRRLRRRRCRRCRRLLGLFLLARLHRRWTLF